MDIGTLAEALEREHRAIDSGVEMFIADHPAGKASVGSLTHAMEGLRRHIYLEEEFVFPPLRAAGLMAPIFVMLREHGEMWKTMDALDAELSKGIDRPALLTLSQELAVQLDRHNAKEEPILYPQVDAAMSAPARTEFEAFLDSGRTPDGWVCTKART